MTDIHLLCAADLHLGRYVPAGHGQPPYPIQAWHRLVDHCLTSLQPIDALLLAGDIFDKDALYIEMYGLLRQGLCRLADRGIATIAVAGNHDAAVLADFQRTLGIENFHLLGADGQWERKAFNFHGRSLHIEGVSFTASTLYSNPLHSCSRQKPPPDEPLLGLLHADVDAPPGSCYGPVKSSDFATLPHSAWLLGHIHTPREISHTQPFVRYCGSLQGLDITETGAHGAWLLTIAPTGAMACTAIPLSPLRWEQLNIDLSDVEEANWQATVMRMVETALAEQLTDGAQVERLALRLNFYGRSPLFRILRRDMQRLANQEEASIRHGGRWIPYSIESIKNNTLPPRNLKQLTQGNDLIAVLARQLLHCQENGQLPPHLYTLVEEYLRCDPFLKQCSEAWPAEGEYCALYLSQGFALLDELLEQKQDNL
jgi:DNA repair exonuclease SbcCD nuclease subunit